MSTKNWNCDGSHCHLPNGEVRLFPLPGNGNLILCRDCWAHENAYRRAQGRRYRKEDWPEIDWVMAKVYDNA